MTVKRRVMGTVAALGLALSVSAVLAPVAAAGAAQPQGTQAASGEVTPASHFCFSAPDAPTHFGGSVSITGSVSASCRESATLWIGTSRSGSSFWTWRSTNVTVAPGETGLAFTTCEAGTWEYRAAFRYTGWHTTYGPTRTFSCWT